MIVAQTRAINNVNNVFELKKKVFAVITYYDSSNDELLSDLDMSPATKNKRISTPIRPFALALTVS